MNVGLIAVGANTLAFVPADEWPALKNGIDERRAGFAGGRDTRLARHALRITGDERWDVRAVLDAFDLKTFEPPTGETPLEAFVGALKDPDVCRQLRCIRSGAGRASSHRCREPSSKRKGSFSNDIEEVIVTAPLAGSECP